MKKKFKEWFYDFWTDPMYYVVDWTSTLLIIIFTGALIYKFVFNNIIK